MLDGWMRLAKERCVYNDFKKKFELFMRNESLQGALFDDCKGRESHDKCAV